MKLKELKIELSKIKKFTKLNYKLEQYVTPSEIAAQLIWDIKENIENKKILDLCCGTGMLSAACAYMNPDFILGVDICQTSLEIYRENMNEITDFECIKADFNCLNLQKDFFDVVIMNPPFGTKIKHQDIKALDKALEICKVVYSMHKTSTREYLLNKYQDAKVIAELKYELPQTYDFHRKKCKIIKVDFIRFCRK